MKNLGRDQVKASDNRIWTAKYKVPKSTPVSLEGLFFFVSASTLETW